MRYTVKFISLILDIVFIATLLFYATYLSLPLFNMKGFAVPTGSMEPNIRTGSLVVVDMDAKYDDIELGDIIVYERKMDDKLIIHRVIEINENGMQTQGDANPVPDGILITPDIFVGKYICGAPYLGTMLDWLGTVKGKATYIAFIVAFCVFEMLVGYVDSYKTQNKK